jgi:TniQ
MADGDEYCSNGDEAEWTVAQRRAEVVCRLLKADLSAVRSKLIASAAAELAVSRATVYIPRCPPLPYIPPSFPGEMLSSWLRRIAAEYNVELQHLAGHIGLSRSQAREIDSALPRVDVCSIALALRSHPAEIRDMVHPSQVQVLRATTTPIQVCPQCQARHRAATRLPVAIRARFELWQIECPQCQTPFSPTGAPNSPAAIQSAKTPPGSRAFDRLRAPEHDCWRSSPVAPSAPRSHR